MSSSVLSRRIVRHSASQVLTATSRVVSKATYVAFGIAKQGIATAIHGVVRAAAWTAMTVEQALAAAVPAVIAFLSGFVGLGGLSDKIRSMVREILVELT